MKHNLIVYNSLKREKETLVPMHDNFIGMYVCGPTVYSDVHLGNCRTFVSFDMIYRYLLHKGYRVRYVRNITDVGHLLDDGEDRMSKGARQEQLEPMEVAQKYTNGFHDMMDTFNTLRPNIEPKASGHIIGQIDMVQQIIDNGYGYEINGSVYFDTLKFYEDHKSYGELSGRRIDDLLQETRELKKQGEKRHPSDFAIWMKADEGHIMRWRSPWSVGFPGWHLECSVMSTKYLGKTFDIHGGGNDLKFPHHENEIAQNMGSCQCAPARYWLHTNMLLMNGKKMSKSDGNTISPDELFTGDSEHVSKGYDPTIVRFFMMQSHYRSTLDLTDEGLLAAEKGYRRLMEAYRAFQEIEGTNTGSASELDANINKLIDATAAEMDDDFNTPKALARLFELVPIINSIKSGQFSTDELSNDVAIRLKTTLHEFLFDILGLKDILGAGEDTSQTLAGLMDLILDIRQSARAQRDWAISDKIRDSLAGLKIQIKDEKEGSSWSVIN